MNDVIVRKGTLLDLPQVLNLVVELAVYEKEPDAVTTTLEEYQNLFSESWYEFYVAENEGVILGIAIYYKTFSTWKGKMLYLEDLVVSQNHRGKGIGKALFLKVKEHAANLGCALLKWQVLDWNDPAIQFYEHLDATIEKGWWNGKIILDKEKY